MIFIGETGINHHGNIKIAKKLIKIFKEIRVDVLKFQKRDVYEIK
jgi:sialic acid synthase SpsE